MQRSTGPGLSPRRHLGHRRAVVPGDFPLAIDLAGKIHETRSDAITISEGEGLDAGIDHQIIGGESHYGLVHGLSATACLTPAEDNGNSGTRRCRLQAPGPGTRFRRQIAAPCNFLQGFHARGMVHITGQMMVYGKAGEGFHH